ncbi:MAG: choice-of-anchor L domain-containing protein [Acidobacteriota bacterium]|nr:choice-of-anchor L domain-containing protein [Acidobacteriota bacterium]
MEKNRMDFRSTRTALLWAAFAGSSIVHLQAAPLAVTLTDDPTALASTIFGPGTTIVGTPTLSSQPGQSGVFTNFSSGPYTKTGGASGMYNLASGIILTTGIASGAEGNYIGGPSFDASGQGDAMLSAISGSPTFDADVLTIKFTASNPKLGLNFVFASSEYPEFVGSTPTDPIGIWINGTNVAVVPGAATPISVNSINANTNSNYFTQYSTPDTPFNYGGATTVLTATADVSTSSVNTIRFAIADAGDGSLDSALLIQNGNLGAVPEPSTWLLSLTGAGLICGFVFFRGKAGADR